MSWQNANWLFIDTETTGLNPADGARVIELGWARVVNLKIVKTGNWLLNPGVQVPAEITNITGIKQEDLEGQPSFKDISHKFYNEMVSSEYMMAFNVKFDKGMIDNEFKLINMSPPQKQWLDPLIWIRRFLQLGDNKLKTVTQHFKVELERAHRADADAEAAALATIKFINSFEGKAMPDNPSELANMEKVWDADQRVINKTKYQSKTKLNKP